MYKYACLINRAPRCIEKKIGNKVIALFCLFSPFKKNFFIKEIEFCKDPALSVAQNILTRVRKRHLYKMADEFLVPADVVAQFPSKVNSRVKIIIV